MSKKLIDLDTVEYHLMYLPYQVQVYRPVMIWSGQPPEPSHEEYGTETLYYENLTYLKDWPIVLRHIFDIHEPIDLDGETFIPYSKLSPSFHDFNLCYIKVMLDYSLDDINYETFNWKLEDILTMLSYSDAELLKKWNFDFLGLIEQDIALNYKTYDN